MADAKTGSGDLIAIYTGYKLEAEAARLPRIQQNKYNYDMYQLRQDYSHKQKGQSQEVLPNQAMAVEQNANLLMQGLVDMGDWFRVYPAPGMTEDMLKIKPIEIQKILTRQLEKAQFMMKVGDSAKLGLLGALMIAKIHGEYVPTVKYKAITEGKKGSYKKKLIKQEDKKWQLRIDLVRQQDWKPDPTCARLYRMEDIYVDWHKLEQMSKNPDYGYDKDVVMMLKAVSGSDSTIQEYEKSRETGMNMQNMNFRHRIKITEVWGDFVSPGGDLLFEKCVATIANDTYVLKAPTDYDFWHGEDPYVATPIMTVPHSEWGKTPVDAGTMLNIAINELFNLILDGGMAAVHGIKQLRPHWLEDPAQVEDGIPPGTTLLANTSCPPGMAALERVDTTTLPPEALPVFNLIKQEFNTAMMTDDMRMGVQSYKDVKATQIVENSQAITSMFSGIAKHLEVNYITPILYKAWLTCAQHLNDFDLPEMEALLGPKRAAEIAAMGPEELFAETANAIKIEVFGISATMNKKKGLMGLKDTLQTIMASPPLMEEFTKTYDFNKLLTEILIAEDVPIYKIQTDDALNGPQGQPPQQPGAVMGATNMQSQIPQAGSQANQAAASPMAQAQPGSPIPSAPVPNFPGSAAAQGR